MRAAWILKKDFDLETRIINLHTLKPVDEATIVRAAKETGIIVTAEELSRQSFNTRQLKRAYAEAVEFQRDYAQEQRYFSFRVAGWWRHRAGPGHIERADPSMV